MAGDAVVSADLLEKVKLVELKTRGAVNTLFLGEYRSVFKGQGMEFAEVREYEPGDEVRTIDWNVTARMRRPYVKRYIEERELTVMLVLDRSASQLFGTNDKFKSELVAEFAAIVSMSAIRNNDRVGMLMFTDQVEHVVTPKKGKRQALRIIRDLYAVKPISTKTDFAPVLDSLRQTLRHHTIVFVISDFLSDTIEQPLKSLSQRHDVVAVTIADPGEYTLPDIGIARFRDPESGELVQLDTSSKLVRSAYAEHVVAEDSARKRVFRRLGIDEIRISTTSGVIDPLLQFFRTRDTRLKKR